MPLTPLCCFNKDGDTPRRCLTQHCPPHPAQVGPSCAFLDVGCGSAYVSALAACLIGTSGIVHGIEHVSSRLELARNNMRLLKERLSREQVRMPCITAEARGLVGDTVMSNAAVAYSFLQLQPLADPPLRRFLNNIALRLQTIYLHNL